jgi:glycosyltransferase involved in cell wall biosynthesis
MRVLHLTTEYPPVIFGGLGSAVGGLVGALADASTDVGVLLVGSGISGYEPTPRTPSAPPARNPRPVHVAERVDVFTTSWPQAHDSALAVCRQWQPDVLHLHVFWLWPIARQLRAQLALPLVYTVHSLDAAEYGQRPQRMPRAMAAPAPSARPRRRHPRPVP